MLNISDNSISEIKEIDQYKTLVHLQKRRSKAVLVNLLIYTTVVSLVIIFLPWTQNIRADGTVTTLRPDQRPQTIHSVIGGRIESWHVTEGQYVDKGDTILFISEVKAEYFDPNLVSRAELQLKAKELTVKSYKNKVESKDRQIQALVKTSELKLQQATNVLQQSRLKVKSDSINLIAAETNHKIAEQQYDRYVVLKDKGLKSLTDLENRKLKMQKAQAEMISAENRLLTSINEVLNAKVEMESIQAQYRDDIAKAESEKFTAMSDMYNAEAAATKLKNQYMNYSIRSGFYYITAPQSGYITQALRSGIGETIKEGTDIVSIMPASYDLAVSMYVNPIDLPLISKSTKVRIQFDGWPAIVFSGWPNISYGTYGGTVVAIDNFISANGKYRILVSPDSEDHEWPKALRVGSGTYNMALLNNVPIWYELWRQINGFPPDFYTYNQVAQTDTDK